ncbi:MAG: efflux RND transporter periplasmic adaptor subunit [Planctomycetota bacterium]|jgi:RND family efflux transporter MFP subunit
MQTDTGIPVQTDNAADAQPTGSGWSPAGASSSLGKLNKRLAVIIIAALILFPAAYFGLQGMFSPKNSENIQLYKIVRRSFPIILQEKGELEAFKSIDIKCELEGRSTIIELVDEGKHVKKGDLLVKLASDEIDEDIKEAEIRVATKEANYEAAVKEHEILKDENASNIRKAKLKLRLAQLALKKYQEGEGVELRQNAKLDLEKAKYVLKRADEQLTSSEKLLKKEYISRMELEDDKFSKYEAEQDLKKAELAQTVLEKYTITMAMEEKESDVVEAEKELKRTENESKASEAKFEALVKAARSELDLVKQKLAKYQDQKKKATTTAPADGMVVYSRSAWYRDDKRIETGAQVYERQSIIELPDTSKMKVAIKVHEAKTELLKVGLPATVEIEAHTGKQFTGKVSKIGVLAASEHRWMNPNLKQYETEILLDGQYTDLKPGITAHAEIQVTELKNVLAVPVQSVFGKEGKYYVFVDKRGKFEPAEIGVGLASNEYVEVTKGLKEGQMVGLAITDEMKLKIPDSKEKPKAKSPPRDKPRVKKTIPGIIKEKSKAISSAPAKNRRTGRPKTKPAA